MTHRCSFCDKGFDKGGARQQHERAKHPEELRAAERQRRERHQVEIRSKPGLFSPFRGASIPLLADHSNWSI